MATFLDRAFARGIDDFELGNPDGIDISSPDAFNQARDYVKSLFPDVDEEVKRRINETVDNHDFSQNPLLNSRQLEERDRAVGRLNVEDSFSPESLIQPPTEEQGINPAQPTPEPQRQVFNTFQEAMAAAAEAGSTETERFDLAAANLFNWLSNVAEDPTSESEYEYLVSEVKKGLRDKERFTNGDRLLASISAFERANNRPKTFEFLQKPSVEDVEQFESVINNTGPSGLFSGNLTGGRFEANVAREASEEAAADLGEIGGQIVAESNRLRLSQERLSQEIFEQKDNIIETLRNDQPLNEEILKKIEGSNPLLADAVEAVQRQNLAGRAGEQDIARVEQIFKQYELFNTQSDEEKTQQLNDLVNQYDAAFDNYVEAFQEAAKLDVGQSESQEQLSADLAEANGLIEGAIAVASNGGALLDYLYDSSYSLLIDTRNSLAAGVAAGLATGGNPFAIAGSVGATLFGTTYGREFNAEFTNQINIRLQEEALDPASTQGQRRIQELVLDKEFLGNAIGLAGKFASIHAGVAGVTGLASSIGGTGVRIGKNVAQQGSRGVSANLSTVTGIEVGGAVSEVGGTIAAEQAVGREASKEQIAIAAALGGTTAGIGLVSGSAGIGANSVRRRFRRSDGSSTESVEPDPTQVGDRPAPDPDPGVSNTNSATARTSTYRKLAQRSPVYTKEDFAELQAVDFSETGAGEGRFDELFQALAGSIIDSGKAKAQRDIRTALNRKDYSAARRIVNKLGGSSGALKDQYQPLINAVRTYADIKTKAQGKALRYDPNKDSGRLGITDGELIQTLQNENSSFYQRITRGSSSSRAFGDIQKAFGSGSVRDVAKAVNGLNLKGELRQQTRAVVQQLNGIERSADTFDSVFVNRGVSAADTFDTNIENSRRIAQFFNQRDAQVVRNSLGEEIDLNGVFISQIEPNENFLEADVKRRLNLDFVNIEDNLRKLDHETEFEHYIRNLSLYKNIEEAFGTEQGLKNILADAEIPDALVQSLVREFNAAKRGDETTPQQGQTPSFADAVTAVINRLERDDAALEISDSTDVSTQGRNASQAAIENAVLAIRTELKRIRDLYDEDIKVVLVDGIGVNHKAFARVQSFLRRNPNVFTQSIRDDVASAARTRSQRPREDSSIQVDPDNDLFSDVRGNQADDNANPSQTKQEREAGPNQDEPSQKDYRDAMNGKGDGGLKTPNNASSQHSAGRSRYRNSNKKFKFATDSVLGEFFAPLRNFNRREKLDVKVREIVSNFENEIPANSQEAQANSYIKERRAIEKALGGKIEKQTPKTQIDMWRYLKGDDVPDLNPKVKVILEAMRQNIDLNSQQLAQRLEISARFAEDAGHFAAADKFAERARVIRANVETYLNRSFIAFSGDKRAYNRYLNAGGRADAIDLLAATGVPREKATDTVDEFILSAKNGDQISLILDDSPGGTPFTGALNERSQLPEWALRALGEDRDVFNTYYKTISVQKDLNSILKFMDGFARIAIEAGLAHPEQDILNRPNFKKLNQIQRKGLKFNPLNEFYVDPVVGDLIARHLNRDVNEFVRALNNLTVLFKSANTIWSPTTHALQYAGFGPFYIATILSGPRPFADAAKAILDFRAERGKGEFSELSKFMLDRGIMQGSFLATELDDIARNSSLFSIDEFTAYNVARSGGLGKKALLKLAKGNQVLANIYGKPDEFLKIVSFFDDYRAYIKDGFSEAEARERAAQDTTSALPTSSKINSLVKAARNPRTFAAFAASAFLNPFLAFQVAATVGYAHVLNKSVRQAFSSNVGPAIRTRAKRRLVGSLAVGAFFARDELADRLTKDDEDDPLSLGQERIDIQRDRELIPNYFHGMSGTFEGFDPDGSFIYDINHLDHPHSLFLNQVRIMINKNNDIGEVLRLSLSALGKDIFGGSPVLGLISGGSQLITGNVAEFDEEMLKYGKSIIPGVYRYFDDLRKLRNQPDTPETRREVANHLNRLARKDKLIMTPSQTGDQLGYALEERLNRSGELDKFIDTIFSTSTKVTNEDVQKAWVKASTDHLDHVKQSIRTLARGLNNAADAGVLTERVEDQIIESMQKKVSSLRVSKAAIKGMLELERAGQLDRVTISTTYTDGNGKVKRLIDPESLRRRAERSRTEKKGSLTASSQAKFTKQITDRIDALDKFARYYAAREAQQLRDASN